MFIEGGGLLPEIKLGERQLTQNIFFSLQILKNMKVQNFS